MRCLWKVKGLRRCRSPHRGAELAPQPRRPRSAREGLRGHRAAHVPVLRRGRDGHRRSRPRRERTYLAAAATVPLMMRTICVLGGLRPLRCARTPFPVIRSCVKMSESNFNTPRRHQLAAQLLYHTLRCLSSSSSIKHKRPSRFLRWLGTAVALLEDRVVVAVARAAAFVSSAALVAAASAPSPPPAPLRMLRCSWRGDGGDDGGIEPVHRRARWRAPLGERKDALNTVALRRCRAQVSFRRRRRRRHRIAVRGKDLQPGGRQGQAGLSWRDTGHETHGRGFRFYQHMLKVRHELKVRSIAPVIRRLYCIHCSDHASLSSVLVVHEWPSMMIWMRCTRDILCSQPEHLISRQIRARTVRDEPARGGTGAIRIFG